MHQSVELELLDLEAQRAAALSSKNWSRLEDFCAPTLTHTHSSGRVEDRSTWLDGLKKRPRAIERSGLQVRVYNDTTAVMSGLQFNAPEGSDPAAERQALQVLQVWVKSQGRWMVVASQTTRVK